MPQFIAEEADVEEIDEEDEDVDIASTTPIMNDDYWEMKEVCPRGNNKVVIYISFKTSGLLAYASVHF